MKIDIETTHNVLYKQEDFFKGMAWAGPGNSSKLYLTANSSDPLLIEKFFEDLQEYCNDWLSENDYEENPADEST